MTVSHALWMPTARSKSATPLITNKDPTHAFRLQAHELKIYLQPLRAAEHAETR
jgi:hypothetical protein